MSNCYTLEHIYNECSNEKHQTTRGGTTPGARYEILVESWAALNKWIENRLSKRKGAGLSMLGTFTWEFKRKNGELNYRPIFILSDTFLKEHLVRRQRVHKYPVLSPSEEVNFSTLAIKYSNSLTKDMVFAGVRDILRKIGEYLDRVYEFEVEFSFGTLKSKERKIRFEFDHSKVLALLPREMTPANVYTPESYLFDEDTSLPPDSVRSDHLQSGVNAGSQIRPTSSSSSVYSDMTARSDRSSASSSGNKYYSNSSSNTGVMFNKTFSKSVPNLTLPNITEEADGPVKVSSPTVQQSRPSSETLGQYSSTKDAELTFSDFDKSDKSAAGSFNRTITTGNGDSSNLSATFEEPTLSPRMQELLLSLHAREEVPKATRLKESATFARSKVIEQAYLRCLMDAAGTATQEEKWSQAEGADLSKRDKQEQLKREAAKQNAKNLKSTLDEQSHQLRARRSVDREERKNMKMAFFLPPNAGLTASHDAFGNESDAVDRREQFCRDLATQIRSKATKRALDKELKLNEEREYLDHIAVEMDMQSAVNRANHLEKQQALLEAWERDAHIRNLQQLQTSGPSAVQNYIRYNMPETAAQLNGTLNSSAIGSSTALKNAGMMGMSIGYDTRRK